MLELKDLHKTFNPGTVNAKTALDGLSLTLWDGEFVTVIGGNGAGKSTMLNAAGTLSVDSGEVHLDGVDVTDLPEYKRAAYIGRMFQDPMMGTAPSMHIEENLALAARRGQKRGLRWGITKAERERYRALLGDLGLGLETRLSSEVSTLSGGQRQALTLLMATLKSPTCWHNSPESAATNSPVTGPCSPDNTLFFPFLIKTQGCSRGSSPVSLFLYYRYHRSGSHEARWRSPPLSGRS